MKTAETNGHATDDDIQLLVRPNSLSSGEAFIEAMWRGKLMHADVIDPRVAWLRKRFVDDVKGKARRIPEWHEYENQQDMKLPYSGFRERGDDDGNLFTWIDQAILERSQQPTDADGQPAQSLLPVSAKQLMIDHPTLAEPVIDGLLRLGECANVIAPSKIGKSWLSYGIAFSVVTGAEWLGFQCRPGKVLLCDNELHGSVIGHRLSWVAQALDLEPEDWQDHLDVLSLRGRLMDLHAICRTVESYEPDRYSLVVLDAWYRSLPAGVSENSNSDVMALYNRIDQTLGKLHCGWANIHHSSKGSQSDKSVVDVGSGAGAQSRAADCHIVLREHETKGIYVLDAAVRSFKPIQPLAIEWQYPLWHLAGDIDPTLLKGRLSLKEQRETDKDKKATDAIIDALRRKGGLSITKLAAEAETGRPRAERLLAKLCREGHVTADDGISGGNRCTLYSLKPEGVV